MIHVHCRCNGFLLEQWIDSPCSAEHYTKISTHTHIYIYVCVCALSYVNRVEHSAAVSACRTDS